MLPYAFRLFGWRPVIGQVMSKLYSTGIRTDPARRSELDKWRQVMTSHDQAALFQFGKGIFNRESMVAQLDQISLPTTIIVGDEDVATPLPRSQKMASLIPKAELHIIPNSGHTSPIEESKAVTAILQQFYQHLNGV